MGPVDALKVLLARVCEQQKSPVFTVRSDQIHVMKTPIDFYLSLCVGSMQKGIKTSHRRILMSSLYIGDGPLEQYLLQLLFNKLELYKHMRLTLVNDYNRSRRSSRIPTVKLLGPLKQNFPPNSNVTLSFFRPPRSPVVLNSIMTLNEIFGVQHTKVCVFDDNVLLTGANMSENYFTERQDRCFVIANCPEFADYCDDLLTIVADVGVQMDEGGTLRAPKYYPDCSHSNPVESKRWRELCADRFKMFNFMHRPTAVPSLDSLRTPQSTPPQHPKPQKPADELVLATERGIQWGRKLRSVSRPDDVFNFLKDLPSDLNVVTGTGGWDDCLTEVGSAVHLFPTLQLGSLGVQDDWELLRALVPQLQEATLASGYLNLPAEMVEWWKKVERLRIVCASPKANGFLGDGVKDWIPYMYRAMEESLVARLPHAEFYEYERPGWTFHTKGLWASANNSPYLTAIGSSNYGS